MARDIGKYHAQIAQFVDGLCRIYYKHSQPEDRGDLTKEVALITHQNREKVRDKSEAAFLDRVRHVIPSARSTVASPPNRAYTFLCTRLSSQILLVFANPSNFLISRSSSIW